MRKKSLQKAVVIGLISSMIVGSFAGCSKSNNTNTSTDSTSSNKSTSSSDSSSSSNSSSSSTSSEKVKLTALYVSHPLTKSLDEMQWIQELEDECGVEVEWEQIYSDWDTTKSTRLASGDIPDLLFNATVDSDYITYNGLFMELTDLIANNGPNITKMFTEQPDTKVLATTLEGKIFATPKFQGKWPDTNTTMFINKTWLDSLGLEVPTTFTELKTVLTAFKEQDANGNGATDDEVPLDYNGWFSGAYSVLNLLGGLGIQFTDYSVDGYFAEDATIKNYAVDERYKKFINYVADLYANGLVNENAITNDYSAFQSLSRGDADGNALVGVTFGWEETDKFGNDLASQYVSFGPLTWDVDSSTYDARWPYDFTGLNLSSNRICMSAQCKNPEAAMKFMDAFYEKTASVEALFGGVTDGCIEVNDENTYTVLAPLDSSMDPGTWKWTSTFADWGPMYINPNTTVNMPQDMTNAINERAVYAEAIAKVDRTKDYYPQMFMKYSDDDQNTLAYLQANISNITNNFWALWVTGESDINEDWDSYVEAVNQAGLQDVLKIRQEAYDRYLASLE